MVLSAASSPTKNFIEFEPMSIIAFLLMRGPLLFHAYRSLHRVQVVDVLVAVEAELTDGVDNVLGILVLYADRAGRHAVEGDLGLSTNGS